MKQTLQLEAESHTAIFQKSGQTYLLEARADGQILLSPFSAQATSLELNEVGEASMPDGSAAKGIRVVNEDVVLFSESHILVSALASPDSRLCQSRLEANASS